MATLPNPDEIKRATPNPALSAERVPVSEQTALADQQMRSGAQITKAGDEMQSEFDKEMERVNKMRAEDAFSELRNAQLELTMGKDGFNSKRGGDALKTPLLANYTQKFKEASERIAGTLDNEDQRQAFKQRAAVAQSQYTHDLLGHLAKENDVYARQVLKATIDTETRHATARWDSPLEIAGSVNRINAAIAEEARRTGVDPVVAEDMRRDALAPIYKSIITQAIAGHNLGYAKAVLQEATKSEIIDAKSSAHFTKEIEVGDKQAKVLTYSDNLFATTKGYKEQMKQVQQDFAAGKIDAATREGAEHRIDKARAVAEHIKNEGDKYMMGQAQELVLQNTGKSVMDMPPNLYAWAKNSGHLAGLDAFATREGRPGERIAELETRGKLMQQAAQDPDSFIADFKKTAFANRFDLGANGIKEMQNIAQSMMAGNGKYKIDFDQKILQDAIPKELLSPGKKDAKDAFVGLQHEAMLQWKKDNPGKMPTIEDQKQVARSANAEFINAGYFNTTAKAFELKEGNQDYMPVEMFNAMKATGAKDKEAGDFFREMKKRGATNTEIMTAWALKKGAK